MATITLKDGDFGGEATVVVGETALYLPDRARPGLNELVPLTAIAEIEDVADDRTGQLKQAAPLGVRGLLAMGNPLGLAAGVFAVGKVKDVEFAVTLKDGRRFVATANATTLANLRAASRSTLVAAGEDADAEARADAVIAKYIGPEALPLPTAPGTAAPASLDEPDPSASLRERAGAPMPRGVFGRRGRR
jgi:hypothetical protein